MLLISEYISIFPKRGPCVVKQTQATERHCSLHWPSLCLSLWRRSQQPSVSQHSSSKTPIETQQWSEQTQGRKSVQNGSKWLTLCWSPRVLFLDGAAWSLMKFHFMFISTWKQCVVRGGFPQSKRSVCLWDLCLLIFHRSQSEDRTPKRNWCLICFVSFFTKIWFCVEKWHWKCLQMMFHGLFQFNIYPY